MELPLMKPQLNPGINLTLLPNIQKPKIKSKRNKTKPKINFF